MTQNTHPHQGAAVFTAGEPLDQARAAVVMLHGRGANAPSILTLAEPLHTPEFAYVAPEAVENTWYPYPFLAPTEQNEPWLSSALQTVGDVLAQVAEAGILPEKTLILGFSQGACLALEYAARNTRRYGGVAAFTGGLISLSDPDGTRHYSGSLDGTPVFLGCSDIDPHIPLERLKQTTQVLRDLDGDVTERVYPGMGHTVNQDEIDFVRGMMASLIS
jgi:phospholipase/carboxylesterase